MLWIVRTRPKAPPLHFRRERRPPENPNVTQQAADINHTEPTASLDGTRLAFVGTGVMAESMIAGLLALGFATRRVAREPSA